MLVNAALSVENNWQVLMVEENENMNVILVGSGKLANEILDSFTAKQAFSISAWAEKDRINQPAIVVHAGSGRELSDVVAFCEKTDSVLIELSTGSKLLNLEVGFPVIVCANTNVLMLKFMALMENAGSYFKGQKIGITESHQSEKISTPGTAIRLADSFGVSASEIRSVRDPVEQTHRLHIPVECLSRHAYHQIKIEDGSTSITFETKVFGEAPYAEGLAKIIAAVEANKLERRRYDVIEFVQNRWI